MIRRAPHAVPRAPTTRRQLLIKTLAGAGAIGLSSIGCATASSGAASGVASPVRAALPTGTVHDFDFFVGHWSGLNRRLKRRWVGSNDWDEFPGSLRCESRLAGVVNISEVEFPTKQLSGLTVRSFDLETRVVDLLDQPQDRKAVSAAGRRIHRRSRRVPRRRYRRRSTDQGPGGVDPARARPRPLATGIFGRRRAMGDQLDRRATARARCKPVIGARRPERIVRAADRRATAA